MTGRKLLPIKPGVAANPLPNTDDLRVFVWVARLSSFTKAAEQLQLPRPTISTSIQRLEDRLGARLLQRTTRRVQITREGEELLDRCERLLEDLDEIGSLFQLAGPQLRGRLRVDMPLGMASSIVIPQLAEFAEMHPELQVEVFSTDRRVDLLREGFDMVLRAGPITDESLVFRPLPPLQLLNVAALAYVEKYGFPTNIRDLSQHWLINYQPNSTSITSAFEYYDQLAQQTMRVPMRHIVTVNNSVAYDSACRAGLGIAQIPKLRATKEIHAGKLVQILPEHPPADMELNLLFPHRRNIPKRVRLFADWISDLVRASAF